MCAEIVSVVAEMTGRSSGAVASVSGCISKFGMILIFTVAAIDLSQRWNVPHCLCRVLDNFLNHHCLQLNQGQNIIPCFCVHNSTTPVSCFKDTNVAHIAAVVTEKCNRLAGSRYFRVVGIPSQSGNAINHKCNGLRLRIER